MKWRLPGPRNGSPWSAFVDGHPQNREAVGAELAKTLPVTQDRPLLWLQRCFRPISGHSEILLPTLITTTWRHSDDAASRRHPPVAQQPPRGPGEVQDHSAGPRSGQIERRLAAPGVGRWRSVV